MEDAAKWYEWRFGDTWYVTGETQRSRSGVTEGPVNRAMTQTAGVLVASEKTETGQRYEFFACMGGSFTPSLKGQLTTRLKQGNATWRQWQHVQKNM